MPDLHAGFQRSDADARNDGLFAFLERVDGLPHVQAIKRHMADLLRPSAGQHLLEVGCGMGITATRSSGWSSQLATLSRAPRDAPGPADQIASQSARSWTPRR
jgi:hypothetical protein